MDVHSSQELLRQLIAKLLALLDVLVAGMRFLEPTLVDAIAYRPECENLQQELADHPESIVDSCLVVRETRREFFLVE